MPTTELDHLVKMVNQIADNISIGEDDATIALKVADHLNRFWARSMKEQIVAYAKNDGRSLNAAAKLAIARL